MKSLFENVKPNVDFVSKFKELKEFCEDSETENLINYLQNNNLKTFKVPTNTYNIKELCKFWTYNLNEEKIKRILSYVEEYDGMTSIELEKLNEERVKFNEEIANEKLNNTLEYYNKASNIIKNKVKNINVEIPSFESIVKKYIGRTEDIDDKRIIIYAYVGNDSYNSFGFVVDIETEKVEVFEENDESNEETYSAVIVLTKNPDEYVKVYTTQPEEICRFIEEHNQVKAGMFVSTLKDYSKGYLEKGRDTIYFDIQYKNLEFHSNVDFKVSKECNIKNFGWL